MTVTIDELIAAILRLLGEDEPLTEEQDSRIYIRIFNKEQEVKDDGKRADSAAGGASEAGRQSGL
ncbi:MAG: hypothetical protein IJ746_07445 [Ruminococcus sp.]|nr:hypothetical protein [Ruminococcus sp.]